MCAHDAATLLTEQLISNWYPRHVLAKRIAAFYLGGACLGGFGNIIAYGWGQIAPRYGLAGWQWILCVAELSSGRRRTLQHHDGRAHDRLGDHRLRPRPGFPTEQLDDKRSRSGIARGVR